MLVCGTASDAGKSVVTAGICRWLARAGVRVAPFKAQNMANNSAVTAAGAEIGRAQALQAAAAGVEPEAAMNPVLIKPSGERHSQVLLMGRRYADADARSYQELKPVLREAALDALADLRARYDVVVCEGAGSPAEINLRARRPREHGPRARGRASRSCWSATSTAAACSRRSTAAWRCSSPTTRRWSPGFVINKFRGDDTILAPGLEQLLALTGRPTLGVLPVARRMWLDAEDSLALEAPRPEAARARRRHARGRRRPAARMSNFTDVDALTAEPGVSVRFTRSPADVERADLVSCRGRRRRSGPRAPARRRPRRRPGAPRGRGRPDPRRLRRLPDARRGDRGRGREPRAARWPARAAAGPHRFAPESACDACRRRWRWPAGQRPPATRSATASRRATAGSR